MAYKLGNIEMKYRLWPRNIEISEKTKHVEDLGHDVRTDIYIYIYINNRKIIAAVRLGGLAPARPIKVTLVMFRKWYEDQSILWMMGYSTALCRTKNAELETSS